MPQPTTDAIVSVSGNSTSTPFPSSTDGPPILFRFINGASGSGAFDVSYDGGSTWHLGPGSAAPFAEDIPNLKARIAPASLRVRANGNGTVTSLTVKSLWG